MSRTILVHEYVTGGGLAGQDLPASWAAEGGAMRRALAKDFARLPGHTVVMTLDDRLPDEPGPWTVARIGPGAERDRLRELAATAVATLVVAPETDDLLRERAGWLDAWGARSLGCRPDGIEQTADKFRFGLQLASLGIPTPPGRLWEALAPPPAPASFPVVVKPRDGAGSIDTHRVSDAAGLAALPAASSGRLIQPMVAGIPVSVSYLVGSDGSAVRVGVARQWVEMEREMFQYAGGSVPCAGAIPVAAFDAAIAAVPGLRGWVGLDGLWDAGTGTVTVLELNPRPTTSYVGWRQLFSPGLLARLWFEDRPAAPGDRVRSLTPDLASGGIRFWPSGRCERDTPDTAVEQPS